MEERDNKSVSTNTGNKFWNWVRESRLSAALASGVLVFVATMVIANKEEKSRSYDLLSGREIATNDLQMKIFDVYVDHVVPALNDGKNDNQKVALLAGLHSNFSEFFDTRPVFETFASTVEDPTARHELTRLAKRVARRQAQFITAHMDLSEEHPGAMEITLRAGDSFEFDLEDHHASVQIMDEPHRHYTMALAAQHKKKSPALSDADDDLIDDVSDFVTIELILNQETGGKETKKFELSYMDTPYMDNIWLRHKNGHDQLALRLVDIDTRGKEHSVTIEIIHFPGDVYAASQRLPVSEVLAGGH